MRLVIPLCAVLLSACAPDPQPSPVKQLAQKKTPAEEPAAADDPEALTVMRFLGTERAAAITRAVRAESYRVEAFAGGKEVADDLHGHRVMGRGEDLTKAQLDEFRRLILDEGSYLFPMAKECEWVPGVAIRMYGTDRTQAPIDVLLCFSCDEWGFPNYGKPAQEDFDPVQPQLAALAKALFPKDAVIQGIKVKTSKKAKK